MQAVADYIDRAQQRLETLIRRQFPKTALLMVMAAVLFLGLLVAAVVWFSVPANDGLIRELQQSNSDLSKLAQSVSQAQSSPAAEPVFTAALQAVVTQSDIHVRAIDELRRTQRELRPEALTVLQLAGGSVLLALFGYLGLQRLQNIDTELDGLRRYMFDQIRERTADGREVLRASIGEAVDERFDSTRAAMEGLATNFREYTQNATDAFQVAASEATKTIEGLQANAAAIFERYSWLQSPEVRDVADRIRELVSVGQAHEAATKLESLRLAGSQPEFLGDPSFDLYKFQAYDITPVCPRDARPVPTMWRAWSSSSVERLRGWRRRWRVPRPSGARSSASAIA